LKAKQQEITSKMQKHVKADEAFYITAHTILSLASRARDLFESSEVEEKRQLLNFVFQNLTLEREKLAHTVREPFSLIMNMKACPSGWEQLDEFRTFEWESMEIPCEFSSKSRKSSTSSFVFEK
jgi:site-specific DNA recombinase